MHSAWGRVGAGTWMRPDDKKGGRFGGLLGMLMATAGDSGQGGWKVFDGLPSPSDVSQGALGDCWFLGAVSALAERPDLIKRLFITDEVNQAGVYCVQLCKDGVWHHILVDDVFPTMVDGQFAFSQPVKRQLWVMILEKAMAKLHGSYQALVAGTGDEALRTLTGFPIDTVRLEPDPNAEYSTGSQMSGLDAELTWTKLQSYDEAGFVSVASCGRSTQGGAAQVEFDAMGLISSHVRARCPRFWAPSCVTLTFASPSICWAVCPS